MATVRQGVDYEITASDKTAQATDSVMKRIDAMREKEKAAAKERKAESEKNQAQLQKSKGLMQSLGAAASGSWSAMAKGLASAVAGTKALNSALMKFGPYLALFTAIVAIIKGIAGAFAAVKERVDKIQFDNIKSGLDSIKKQTEAFNAALELTKAKYESAADALDRQLEATKALKDAQDEYNKALELSLAKTDKEREAIERKYEIMKDLNAEEMDAAKRENARNRSDAKIAAIEEQLASLRDDNKDIVAGRKNVHQRWQALAKRNTAGGFVAHLSRWWRGSDAAQRDLTRQNDLAEQEQAYSANLNTNLEQINKLKVELEAEKKRRAALDIADKTATYQLAAKDVADVEKKASKDTGRDLEDYTRWKESGSTKRFEDWREDDRKAQKKQLEKRQKQYRDWLEEMGRATGRKIDPETYGGEAFKKFSKMMDDQDAAKAKAEAEKKAADEQKAAEEARTREHEKAEAERERIRKQKIDATAAYQAAKDNETTAQQRLAAAKAAVSQAWGWYRDKDSMKAQLEEEKADAEARRQYEKDFEKLSFRRDWRTAKNLSVDQEAVRRVALAKEEEAAAQKAAIDTAENTARSAKALESIESVLNGGGE